MSLLKRCLVAFACGIAGAGGLQFADYAEALDRTGLDRIASEPADMNLGDCIAGHTDPAWPAQYRAICADLAAGGANDTLETASISPRSPSPAPLPLAVAIRPKPETVPMRSATVTPASACTVDARGATTLRRRESARILPPALAARKSSSQRQSGVALIVEPACTVQSPVDGKVMYAGDFKGYRGIVIVRMKTGHQLIIAGLDRLDVARGGLVTRGADIGATSQSRAPALATAYGAIGPKNSLLYFDLRNADGDGVTPDWLPKAG